MIAQHLIAQRTPASGPLRCACCRQDVAALTPIREVVSDGFRDWDRLDPTGEGFCDACRYCFRERPLRYQSFLATGVGVRLLRRAEVLPSLLDPPTPPFVFCVTRSMKKHNAPFAQIAMAQTNFPVRVEAEVVWIDRGARALAILLRELYIDGGVPKIAIATGHWTSAQIRKIGLEQWRAAERRLAPIRGTGLFRLLLDFLYTPKGNEHDDRSGSGSDTGI